MRPASLGGEPCKLQVVIYVVLESVDSKVLVHENKPNSEIEPLITVKKDNIQHYKVAASF